MFIEPKACWRHIDIRERRTAIEFAEEMGKLVDVRYPEAEKSITVVLANLNTHTLTALYEAFERYLQELWIGFPSRGDLLLASFYQLPIPELGSGSYERHQVMSV